MQPSEELRRAPRPCRTVPTGLRQIGLRRGSGAPQEGCLSLYFNELAFHADQTQAICIFSATKPSEARRLPSKDRARLIRRLIASLDAGDDTDAEEQWLDEAERRLEAYQRGESAAVPGEEVFDAILKRLE